MMPTTKELDEYYTDPKDRRISQLEERGDALLSALKKAIADIERTGYVSVPTCVVMEEAIRIAKEK